MRPSIRIRSILNFRKPLKSSHLRQLSATLGKIERTKIGKCSGLCREGHAKYRVADARTPRTVKHPEVTPPCPRHWMPRKRRTTPVSGKAQKADTPKAIEANKRNGRLSRGPRTPEGKSRSRLNACKHNLELSSLLLPGEDGDELKRRLEVWPEILGAETEVEHFEAVQVVHLGWRRARSLRSDDAETRTRMMRPQKAPGRSPRRRGKTARPRARRRR